MARCGARILSFRVDTLHLSFGLRHVDIEAQWVPRRSGASQGGKNTNEERGESRGWETAPRCPSFRPSQSIPRLPALVRKCGPDSSSPRRWTGPTGPMRTHGVEESNLPQAIKLRQRKYRSGSRLTIKFCGARCCWRGCDNVPVSARMIPYRRILQSELALRSNSHGRAPEVTHS